MEGLRDPLSVISLMPTPDPRVPPALGYWLRVRLGQLPARDFGRFTTHNCGRIQCFFYVGKGPWAPMWIFPN
ncbi:hypothetical protein XENTR_v10007226 [Xenopus tropicalis]|nr:hypothetical protein XENTR_v10007226 [Xenopus tropicalis]